MWLSCTFGNWGKPLPSDLNVNSVCVYVYMYVCHGPARYFASNVDDPYRINTHPTHIL